MTEQEETAEKAAWLEGWDVLVRDTIDEYLSGQDPILEQDMNRLFKILGLLAPGEVHISGLNSMDIEAGLRIYMDWHPGSRFVRGQGVLSWLPGKLNGNHEAVRCDSGGVILRVPQED